MAHRTRPLAAFFLIAACTAPPAEQATKAVPADSAIRRDSAAASATADSSGCPTTGRYVWMGEVRVEREGRPPTSLRIIRPAMPGTPPRPDEFGPELVDPVWSGDLNRDGKADWIVALAETVSSYGDFDTEVYAGCGGERYVEVWGGEMRAVVLHPAKTGLRSRHGWRDLAWVQRHAVPGDDYAFETLLRFNGRQYDTVPGSSYRIGHPDSTRWYAAERQ